MGVRDVVGVLAREPEGLDRRGEVTVAIVEERCLTIDHAARRQGSGTFTGEAR